MSTHERPAPVRVVPPPGATTPPVAQHVIETRDGWRLNVLDLEPDGPPRALVIAGHAMMVDRRTLWRPRRPTLAKALMAGGCRVLLPDLRGRGASGPTPRQGADWSYAQLVADTGELIALGRQLAPELPLVLVGHSLFGHVALAYLGAHPDAPVCAVVALAAAIWNRRWESRRWRWWKKRATMALATLLTRLYGYVPAARLGFGSADEAKSYWLDLHRFVAHNCWTAPDGTDYAQNLARITCPVLQVVSDADRWYADADAALRLGAPIPRRDVLRVGPGSSEAALHGLHLDHMPLVTDTAAAPVWQAIADWIGRRVAAGAHFS